MRQPVIREQFASINTTNSRERGCMNCKEFVPTVAETASETMFSLPWVQEIQENCTDGFVGRIDFTDIYENSKIVYLTNNGTSYSLTVDNINSPYGSVENQRPATG